MMEEIYSNSDSFEHDKEYGKKARWLGTRDMNSMNREMRDVRDMSGSSHSSDSHGVYSAYTAGQLFSLEKSNLPIILIFSQLVISTDSTVQQFQL